MLSRTQPVHTRQLKLKQETLDPSHPQICMRHKCDLKVYPPPVCFPPQYQKLRSVKHIECNEVAHHARVVDLIFLPVYPIITAILDCG